MKTFKAAIITLIVLVLVVGGLIVKTYYDAGEFKNINPHFNAECETISGFLSSDDITIDPKTGQAFISSADRRTRWAGSSHPKLLTFVKYSKDPEKLSPAQVLKITVQKPGSYTVDEIYLNSGEPLSGSSVAAVFGDTMLIGSVFDARVLLCRLQQ